ncbi:MAG: EMC3/TMCO1 family protein [Nitrosopumilus sp.]
MIENIDFGFFMFFIDNLYLQGDGGIFGFIGNRGALGSEDPIVKGVIPTLFAVSAFGIVLNLFNSAVRKKMVDQSKLKRITKETRAYQKERMTAMRAKDQEKINELSKKSAYMNKMSMEMMQMNMRPMMFTFVPLILIFYLVLPHLFSYTVALSPISLNIFPGNFFHLTCTAAQAADPNNVCTQENELYLWAWYFLSSISFSGIIMKLTKTSMDLG